ncbi:transcriptional regulator with XRE-family HTH domain [Anaerosolibacter carboniphilus]|uniref:Transcriptional regulator with XRE-family HTH domain n=1 Tax=Anaerosolibacter carboniphilus TaxID=1417629 RepID=A0A841KWT7_9FIRM|nr:helix-turn-helix transcriptional regulator [Anaerosolibacter carboniphilus]MBB6218094.1 transcriptional regulator with XRE-family HTH domain [Anaerosolibacter carboniphilus]
MPDIYKSFGEKIRKYRKAKHYSTAEFADRLDVSAGFINNIENGRNDVFKLELLSIMLKELDLPLEELFQLEPVNMRYISLNQDGHTLAIHKINGEPEEKIDVINHHLNYIVRSFLSTISEYNCSAAAIEEISKCTVTHFETIRNLKKV